MPESSQFVFTRRISDFGFLVVSREPLSEQYLPNRFAVISEILFDEDINLPPLTKSCLVKNHKEAILQSQVFLEEFDSLYKRFCHERK